MTQSNNKENSPPETELTSEKVIKETYSLKGKKHFVLVWAVGSSSSASFQIQSGYLPYLPTLLSSENSERTSVGIQNAIISL